MSRSDPHRDQPVLHAGAPLQAAKAALIMIHGRGATADDILSLADHLRRPEVAYLAPQAADCSWYPYRFTDPLEKNEPWLSSALSLIEALFARLGGAGLTAERIALLGFSQGACLSLEYAARNARRYGGVFALSGGLIGPPGMVRDDAGSLDGTPVFLGCSDIDPHIPLSRVQESTRHMRALGAEATERIYPGMGHNVNEDEIRQIGAELAKLVGTPSG